MMIEPRRREPTGQDLRAGQTIARRPTNTSVPLTAAQEMFLVSHRWGAASTVDHVPIIMRRDGPLNADALERALALLAARHEALRARIDLQSDPPVQVIEPAVAIALERADFSSTLDVAASARGWIEALIRKPFDLGAAPLLRAGAAELSGRGHLVALVVHHIIVDAWSTNLIRRELAALYEAECTGRRAALASPEIQYGDYAVWEREWIGSRQYGHQLAFWRRQLDGVTPLRIDTDAPRPAVQSYRGGSAPVVVPERTARALRELMRAARATTTIGLFAAFDILLAKYSGQDDIAVGMPAANRGRAELEGVVGLFVNPVVIRTIASPAMTFRALIERLRDTCLDAYAHQQLPFLHLVRELRPSRDAAHTPLFQVMFVMQPPTGGLLSTGGGGLAVGVPLDVSRFDLLLRMTDTNAGIRGAFEYNRDLFAPWRMEQIAAHYERILSLVTAEPDRPLCRIDLDDAASRAVTAWPAAVSSDSVGALQSLPVPLRIEAQAAARPEAAAVSCGAEVWSYRDLNAAANRLARHLRARRIGAEQIVGVAIERSVALVVAELGVLKSGAAFLPLDVGLPPGRLARLLTEAGAACVVTTGTAAGRLPATVPAVVIDEPATAAALAAGSGEDLDDTDRGQPLRAAQAAYVLYTSGSTGRPKGVMVSHRALAAFVDGLAAVVTLGPDDRHLAITNVMADVAVFDLLAPLVHGARVIVARSDDIQSTNRLRRALDETHATSIHLTPTVARLCVAEQPGMLDGRRLFVGGEALDVELARRLRSEGRELWNFYGPTETTIVCTVERFDDEGERQEGGVAIGRALPGVSLHVLDHHLAPVPKGVTGELYVAGDCVARGYRQSAGTTAAQFVASPFGRSGDRMYRTGDLVRTDGDGRLRFVGRADHQVKIHGNRVELPEIEATLRLHPEVENAAVVLFARDHAQTLAAYVQPRRAAADAGEPADTASPTAAEIRTFLRDRLPRAIVPSAIVLLPSLPLTANGKIDRAALPPPAADAMASREAPLTPVEELLCTLFADVLGVPSVGADTDFFDAGGHSVMAMRLIARIEQTLGRALSISDLFDAATPAALAQRLDDPAVAAVAARITAAGGKPPLAESVPIERIARTGVLPLSFNQEQQLFRWWMMTSVVPPFSVRMRWRFQALDADALQRALDEIVRRHEVLRTGFFPVRGARTLRAIAPFIWKILRAKPVQKRVLGASARAADTGKALRLFEARASSGTHVKMRRLDLSRLTTAEREARLRALPELKATFDRNDLAKPPLVRAVLTKVGDDEHLLDLVISHLAFDAWSRDVLRDELAALYDAFARGEPSPLAERPAQYADFAAWERGLYQGEYLKESVEYWNRQLPNFSIWRTPLNVADLSFHRRDPAPTHRLGLADVTFDATVLDRATALAKRENVTVFMLLFAVVSIVLQRYVPKKRVALWAGFANRTRPEVQEAIGWYATAHLLSLPVDGNPRFVDALRQAREVVRGALAYQGMPLHLLAMRQGLDIPKDELDPIPQAAISLNEIGARVQGGVAEGSETTRLRDEPIGGALWNRDQWLQFCIRCFQLPNGLKIAIDYPGDWFEADRIRGLLAEMQAMLLGALDSPETPLDDLGREP